MAALLPPLQLVKDCRWECVKDKEQIGVFSRSNKIVSENSLAFTCVPAKPRIIFNH
jgi:hypothetical protein